MAKDKTPRDAAGAKAANEAMDAIIHDDNDDNGAAAEAEKQGAENEAPEQQDCGDVTLSREEIEKLRSEISGMKQSMDAAILDAQRIQAEFNNYRKRNASLRTDSIDDGMRDVIKGLLPVLDNFERALANSDDSSFAKGTEQIHKQLIEVLTKFGLEEIPAEGVFDPDLHDAVIRDEEGEGESGTITAVLQKGYMVKGKIIRHTMVKVRV